jgi:ubiquinone/menaquinone biosynthesis C-methylase UbiE
VRESEIAKYAVVYRKPEYRMGAELRANVKRWLEGKTGSLLDVGTGRGETLDVAREAGFTRVMGTEVVPDLIGGNVVYAEAYALPFRTGEFDTVTCFEVIEHLLHEDQAPALRELCRVAKRDVILTFADYSTVHDGVELHVGRMPYDQFDALVRATCPGTVERLGFAGYSEGWRITL